MSYEKALSLISGGGGNLIVTAPQGWALNKTWNEIVEAIRSGKSVFFLDDYDNDVRMYPCYAANMVEGESKPYVVSFMYMQTATQAAEIRYSSETADGALNPEGGD